MAIEFLHLVIFAGHGNGLPAGVRGLEELSQSLLQLLERLRRRCVRHREDWTPEIEGKGNICSSTEKEEKHEINRIAKD